MHHEAFIARWTAREGGAERANYQMFLSELCDVIDVPRPDPAGSGRERNDYVFERAVRRRQSDEIASSRRIDLYKRGSFILEAKQSRLPGARNALPGQHSSLSDDRERLGRRNAQRGWDVMMANARRQAEDYVFLLDADHAAPPFIITCDVGHVLELFADFSGSGRAYVQFPDRNSFRIYLEDLRKPEIRDLLGRIWTDPASLDPARESARVTSEIAKRLAAVSRSLEESHDPEEVALFLMRCIFCMFAEGVGLLPKGRFTALLEDCAASPAALAPLLGELWAKMDNADRNERFFSYFMEKVRHFNGNLYRNARVLPLRPEEVGELVAAARHKWIDVDPAIFGTLLEQALDPVERRKLGAHYTPRAYVERLVEATMMDVLRSDWQCALKQAEDAKERGEDREAVEIVRGFHRRLCSIRVLDPACGTGNFLYVSLEMMTKLEGEVLEALARLGANETLGLEGETIDPHQFLGLEVNPRAAAIAELVVWIGYLQQHYRTRTGHPQEPILRAFSNINFGRRDGYDALLTWDEWPATQVEERDGKRVETRPNARRSDWPEAEFIVGNPPFLGGKDLRSRLGDGYAQALWKAHPHMNESADLVMYWWDRAADRLTRKGAALRRFGLVTTNSISQVFQRRVVERHLTAKTPISLVFAIPDHPWTKATKDAAAVRIAMTVAEAGKREGVVWETLAEAGISTDDPKIEYSTTLGCINPDLTIGADVTRSHELLANISICSPGVKLHGAGFLISEYEASRLGLGRIEGLEAVIREYRNGKDLTGRSRNKLVIDLFGHSKEVVRRDFPEVYQHVSERVRYDLDASGKPRTDKSGRRLGREWNNRPSYREKWWVFGEPRTDFRPALEALPRYIATVETAKHRIFQFLDGSILPDNRLVCIASDDAFILAVLSSGIHLRWTQANEGLLENRPIYTKSRCFDPFPFPDTPESLRQKLATASEELDALRKRVLGEHPELTLTVLYNVMEKLKQGAVLLPEEVGIKERGLVLILRELHETIDGLTADAYGWPRDLSDQQVLERLVTLNAERAAEEAEGHVRWLRPDYQAPRFGRQGSRKSGSLDLGETVVSIDRGKPVFPKSRHEQPLAVEAVLAQSGRAMDAASIARAFRGGGRRIEPRVAQVLLTLARYGHISALPDGRFSCARPHPAVLRAA